MMVMNTLVTTHRIMMQKTMTNNSSTMKITGTVIPKITARGSPADITMGSDNTPSPPLVTARTLREGNKKGWGRRGVRGEKR